jgi:hypothetical protein
VISKTAAPDQFHSLSDYRISELNDGTESLAIATRATTSTLS